MMGLIKNKPPHRGCLRRGERDWKKGGHANMSLYSPFAHSMYAL